MGFPGKVMRVGYISVRPEEKRAKRILEVAIDVIKNHNMPLKYREFVRLVAKHADLTTERVANSLVFHKLAPAKRRAFLKTECLTKDGPVCFVSAGTETT